MSIQSEPPPGIYYDVPFERYLTWPYVSKSALTSFAWSPAQYQWDRAFSKEPTPKMIRGSAADCLLFDGPEVFAEKFVGLPPGLRRDRRLKAYKEFLDTEARGRTVLAADEVAEVANIVEAVRLHPLAAKRLDMGRAQVSVVWDDSITGIRCKGRPDLICETGGYVEIVDLKLTGDPRPRAFMRTANDFKYHWQAAMYSAGLRACGLEVTGFVFVVAKDSPVHTVELYSLSKRAIDLGRLEYQAALREYHKCAETNHWPASTGQIHLLDLPGWAYPREEEKNGDSQDVSSGA